MTENPQKEPPKKGRPRLNRAAQNERGFWLWDLKEGDFVNFYNAKKRASFKLKIVSVNYTAIRAKIPAAPDSDKRMQVLISPRDGFASNKAKYAHLKGSFIYPIDAPLPDPLPKPRYRPKRKPDNALSE